MRTTAGESLPVVFYDGEQESSLGYVAVSPSLDFKGLQLILSDRTCLSPHQFSVYLADFESRFSTRIPITAKTNLSAVSREKDCCFLVVLKRSRRERRKKTQEIIPDSCTVNNRFDPPPNLMLLRRDGHSIAINGCNDANKNVNTGFSYLDLSQVGHEMRFRELLADKEKYLMSMGLGLGSGLDRIGLPRTVRPSRDVVCEECETGKNGEFHCCVYDPVIFGFITQAGPIARPVNNSS